MESEEAITEWSIVSIGRYEILFASAPHFDENSGDVEDIPTIQYLNNAYVRYNEVYLQYEIDWKEKGKSINAINFTMPEDKVHLQDVFVTTPHGLIKKNRTGIGATTLELNSPRNSIIVVPTRALAYGKALGSKMNGVDGEPDKYGALYVGGNIPDFHVPTIETYLHDTSIQYKKFLVVADSLPRLLEAIGEEHYKDFFFMVDEIDSYQYDCQYRPKLEDVIDYYFQFPRSHRCLVSATIGEFSNNDLIEEPVINVKFCNPQRRKIKLIHTDKVEVRLKRQIEETVAAFPNDKILVAYNSVSGCATVINSLDESLRTECGILCSSNNEGIIEYYNEIVEDRLPKRITFMTCTYFVGVDVVERFHLITAINTDKSYTLLSTDKLQQIAGRCRHSEGLLSETVIYSTNSRNSFTDLHKVKTQVLDDAQMLVNFANSYPKLKEKFPRSYYFRDDFIAKDLIEGTSRRYIGSKTVQLIRQNIKGEIVPSFFNIDFVRIQVDLLCNLYSNPSSLPDRLEQEGHMIEVCRYTENEDIPESVRGQTDTEIQGATLLQREEMIAMLREKETIEERETAARSLIRQRCSMRNKSFLERFIEVQKYIPFDTLIEKLNDIDTVAKYDDFYKSVMFWALEDSHPFKAAFYNSFPINELLTGAEFTERFNAIYYGLLSLPRLTPKTAFPLIKCFCQLSNRTSKRVNGKPEGAYRVIGYNPLGLECEPLERISASVPAIQLFRF